MTARLFIGDREVAAIEPGNRGLAYGDGLFETMRVHHGTLPLWPRHLARLREGAARLGIAMPTVEVIEARIQELAAGCTAGVLKLLLARGGAARGYAPSAEAPSMWMLSLHPPSPTSANGLRLGWCETRLASQPSLAGLKHCNRLEQVLGRAEVVAADRDEGLMRDMAGNAVCATSANLLAFRDGRWLTPRVESCGVAGVLRGWLLAQGLVEPATLSAEQVASADALALCNAVRGILPVASLDARAWPPSPALDDLQGRLSMAYPMFAEAKVVA
jgi:4-amino-4-deoxychorismate lyase